MLQKTQNKSYLFQTIFSNRNQGVYVLVYNKIYI